MSAGAEQLSRGLAEVFRVIRQASAFGEATSENGATMYGHVPHVAPEAWFHIVYPGLDDQEMADVECSLGRPIPAAYRQLLKVSNGLTLFSGALSLEGRRRDYSRKVSIRLPFDLADPNVHERPRAADQAWFIFGFYQSDGSRAWIDPLDGGVCRGNRNLTQPRLNQWPSLDDFLTTEVTRLSAHFDDSGRRLNPTRPTTPDAELN
jgi:hypothetical protein